jgi:hypothetical protein
MHQRSIRDAVTEEEKSPFKSQLQENTRDLIPPVQARFAAVFGRRAYIYKQRDEES